MWIYSFCLLIKHDIDGADGFGRVAMFVSGVAAETVKPITLHTRLWRKYGNHAQTSFKVSCIASAATAVAAAATVRNFTHITCILSSSTSSNTIYVNHTQISLCLVCNQLLHHAGVRWCIATHYTVHAPPPLDCFANVCVPSPQILPENMQTENNIF